MTTLQLNWQIDPRNLEIVTGTARCGAGVTYDNDPLVKGWTAHVSFNRSLHGNGPFPTQLAAQLECERILTILAQSFIESY